MKIGILGGGNVGGALGLGWAKHGHEVLFGVRGPDAAEMLDLLARCENRAHAGTPAEAAAFGPVVVNCLPWPITKNVIASLDLTGKILLDATNPLLPGLAGIEVGTTSSGGEILAGLAPGAHVVKIFNTTGFGNMANPIYHGESIPMFYCGDNAGAKATAAGLARDIGFEPIDSGPLSNSRQLEPLAMLWIWLAHPGGMGRDFAFQIVKR